MKVLIINPILYTNETSVVKKVPSVKDCMICDLCSAFAEKGHDVTLIAAEEFKPTCEEEYSFKIIWMKSYLNSFFKAYRIPYNKDITEHLRKNKYDLIISSEVFSMDTLLAVKASPRNLIIWQEMAFHQKMAKQMASKFWHKVIIPLWYKDVRIVPRTDNAKAFIKKYCTNVSDTVIQHGIDLKKFDYREEKTKTFMVSSQLVPRKRIDKIITAFKDFCDNCSTEYVLNLAGDGESRQSLEELCASLGISDKVRFLGKLPHKELVDYLADAVSMLIYTEKDNSMISIPESIAVGTPVITTSVPDNSTYIRDNKLGIVSDTWGADELKEIAFSGREYIHNCRDYRENLDNKHNVDLFVKEYELLKEKQ